MTARGSVTCRVILIFFFSLLFLYPDFVSRFDLTALVVSRFTDPKLSVMAEIHDQFDTILILDFGSQVCGKAYYSFFFGIDKGLSCFQYSHLITRRCREHNVYAELMPCTTMIKDLKFKPKG